MLFCMQYYLLDRKYLIPDATNSPATKHTSIIEPKNIMLARISSFEK